MSQPQKSHHSTTKTLIFYRHVPFTSQNWLFAENNNPVIQNELNLKVQTHNAIFFMIEINSI